MNKKGLKAAVVAALLASALGVFLLHKAPHVAVRYPVTQPSTRGFGAPCDGNDFTQVPVLSFGTQTWNKGAELPMLAVTQTIHRLGIWEPRIFSGTYNCRNIAGTSSWSHHAWAVAVDVDAPMNPMGRATQYCEINRQNHPSFISTFIKYGFYWGGDFGSRPDCMHFEYDGPALPMIANRYPGGADKDNKLAHALDRLGLPSTFDGKYDGVKEETAVAAFQKKNGLLQVDKGAIVGPSTWTLLLLGGRS